MIGGVVGRTQWKKPELTVLVRGRPEEAVLETCKSEPQWITGPAEDYFSCNAVPDVCYDDCSANRES